MHDVAIVLDDVPGALAKMGVAVADAGLSIEGGGAWVVEGRGIAHFLFVDGHAARTALESRGLNVARVSEVVMLKLHQSRPGQLGLLTLRMADAGINIEVLYSDHDHNLVLVTSDPARAGEVAGAWMRETW
ncbi:MAG: amino acid-binding ACT domain-containing protein [Proteobacteria bacterium]|nr:amino acid-binding ACT domain-containing protein [Pseudomonadota bacterium]